ncbi:hypothetical protein [Bacillus subtilis]|uniref:hypothetical protein n=1 Tax=Bacillus subtilis TaxID=1423 RepID=UPI0025C9411C|nr:hypothetical protein [Bacillus subtilis]GLI90515.1 hypothetical protein ANABIO4_38670 [Bacillus subtilis]
MYEETVTVFVTKVGKKLYEEGKRFLAIDHPPSYVENLAHIHPYNLVDGKLVYQKDHKMFAEYTEALVFPKPISVIDVRDEVFYDEVKDYRKRIRVFTVIPSQTIPNVDPLETVKLKDTSTSKLLELYELSVETHHKFERHQNTKQFKVALVNLNKCREELKRRLGEE